MVKYLLIGLGLLCAISLVSGCANVIDRPLPFQNYCGFCDSKIPEPIEPAPTPPPPEPKPKPAVVEKVKKEVVVREKIVLRGINFDFDKSSIKPEFIPVLDEAVEILKTNPEVNVIIEGHTCWIGTEKYNQGLSERRAASVYNYLVEKGISQNRLNTKGYGETMPIADNHTLEGRRMNRRVMFKILD